MKKLTPITMPVDVEYLQQGLEQFPVNCLLHKGKTGCGGTEMVLGDKRDTIIAVPTRDLIKNKIEPNANRSTRRDSILGVMEGVDDSQIAYYLRDTTYPVKKIMVTYDSLPKVIKVIHSLGGDAYRDYFLLVDEYHRLFLDNLFRDKAVKRLLKEAVQFKSVTFMTATPVDELFMLEELKHLPVQEIKWEGKEDTWIGVYRSNSLLVEVLLAIKRVQDGTDRRVMNLHFFVNSVAFIAAVIRRAELKPGEFRVICANTAGNREKLGDTVEIASTSSTAKKFNFYTSTVFEGSDILDPDGYTIVVSDDSTTGRVIDISTSMKQIVGRIRDSKYKGQLFYICPFARKQDVSFSKYAEITLTELQKANKMAERVNALPVEQREWEIKRLKPGLNDTYISVEETRLEVDRNKYMLDLFDYKKRCELRISNTGMIATLEAQDYRVYRMNKEYHDSMLSLKLLTGKKVRKDFKKYFEEYVLLMAEREQRGEIAYQVAKIFHGIEDRLGVLEKDYPLVGEAYRKLGVEKVRQMNYRTSNIKRALDKLEKTPDGKRVIHYIKKRYPLPCTRTVKEWNNTLEEIYRDELNLTGVKAVSTDLGKWFELERRSVNNLDKSGKTIDVITLLRERTILDTGTGKEMTGGVKNDQEGEE